MYIWSVAIRVMVEFGIGNLHVSYIHVLYWAGAAEQLEPPFKLRSQGQERPDSMSFG
jgi:hypothetical protein